MMTMMSSLNANQYTANLIVIIDDDDDYNDNDNSTSHSYILTLFNRKLKKLDIFLRKIFFITKRDYEDIKRQVALMYADLNGTSWLFITTTHSRNDPLMEQVVSELHTSNGKCVEHVSRVFLLKNVTFISDLRRLMNHLLVNRNRFKLLFKSETSMSQFKEALLMLDANHETKDQFSLEQVPTNYASFCLDVIVNNLSILQTWPNTIREQFLSHSAPLTLLGNRVNADTFLYEFDQINFRDDADEAADIKFLLTKVDLPSFKLKLKASIECIETALKRYDTNQLCISFNGGKDCCVVFYLFYAVCLRVGARFPLKVLLIHIRHQFDEMNVFVQKVIKRYYGEQTLEFIVFDENSSSKTLKDCLIEMRMTHSIVKGILMGTRRTDSSYFKTMNSFALTDGDWPKYMRVNPILDWTYSEIWFFIRLLKLPYCSLYDRGFTSVDNTLNTVPNQDLLKEDGTFLPAYWLQDQEAERKSRKK